MFYYAIQYMRGTQSIGRYYNVRSEKEYKVGDRVRLYGGKRAVIVGEGDQEYIEKVGDEGLTPIVGKEEDKDG